MIGKFNINITKYSFEIKDFIKKKVSFIFKNIYITDFNIEVPFLTPYCYIMES